VSARRAALTVALLLPFALAGARAQDNPSIQTAVRLAGEGRGDEARRLVNAELVKVRVGEPAYVEALYWRARLAASGDSAERDLRRVAIEYPTSRWADHALLQLAQIAMAAGNSVSAFALAQRLRSDYPDSDLRPRAALWAGRAAFDLGDARGACALLDSARTEGADDVEFTNQVAFYRARCAGLPAAPPPGAGPAPPPPAPSPPPHADSARARPSTASAQPPAATPANPAPAVQPVAPRGGFAIQAAAVRTAAEADRILRKLRGAGLTAQVLLGADHLRRIRVGSYASEGAARNGLASVRRIAGGRPFVVREP
jgi:cell division septation protein DedD